MLRSTAVRGFAVVTLAAAVAAALVAAPAGAAPSATAETTTQVTAAARVVPTTTRTLVDTGRGVNAPHRALLGGEQVGVATFGVAGVPEVGVAAVRVRIQTSQATGTGVLSVHHGITRDAHPAVLTYRRGGPTEQSATITSVPNGLLVVENVSDTRVQVHVWVTGYVPLESGDAWTTLGGATLGGGHANPAAAGVSVPALRHLRAVAAPRPFTIPVTYAHDVIDYLPMPGSRQGYAMVQARDAASGKVRWTVKNLPGGTVGLQVYDGWLFVFDGAARTDVIAIDLATHRVVAEVVLPFLTTIVGVDSGLIVALVPHSSTDTDNRDLVVVDSATGVVRWRAVGVRNVVAGDGRVAFSNSDGAFVDDTRTGHRLFRLPEDPLTAFIAGGRLFVYSALGVDAFPLTGCGRALCRPQWHATGGMAKRGYFALDIEVSGDGSVVALAYSRIGSDTGGPDNSRLALLSARTGHTIGKVDFSGVRIASPPVVAGPLVLFALGTNIVATPTSCRGTCRVYRIRHVTGDATATTAAVTVAQHTIVFDPDGQGSRIFSFR